VAVEGYCGRHKKIERKDFKDDRRFFEEAEMIQRYGNAIGEGYIYEKEDGTWVKMSDVVAELEGMKAKECVGCAYNNIYCEDIDNTRCEKLVLINKAISRLTGKGE